jgi:hypothetical protein
LQRRCLHLPEAQPHQRWIILLGMFTGARLNEICGLATADIAELEGVPIIHIRSDTRILKTASARRIIPIHPVIRPAFLAYASTIDHERLFPELSLDSRGRFSDSSRSGSAGSCPRSARPLPARATTVSGTHSGTACAKPMSGMVLCETKAGSFGRGRALSPVNPAFS